MSRKQKKYHYIYKTIDTRNGNYYIGMHSTDDLNDGYIGSGLRLKHLIYKHGKEIFNMEILEFLPDRESLKKREAEIVNSDLLLEDKCMNLRPGGEGVFVSKEQQAYRSSCGGKAAAKTRFNQERLKWLRENDEEWVALYRKHMSESLKGREGSFKNKTHSDETKQLMREKAQQRTGEKNSQFGTMWITNGVQDKKIKNNSDIPQGWNRGRRKIK